MMLIDPETNLIVDINPAACNYYGYPFEKMVGMKASEINVLSEERVLAEWYEFAEQKMQKYHVCFVTFIYQQ